MLFHNPRYKRAGSIYKIVRRCSPKIKYKRRASIKLICPCRIDNTICADLLWVFRHNPDSGLYTRAYYNRRYTKIFNHRTI